VILEATSEAALSVITLDRLKAHSYQTN